MSAPSSGRRRGSAPALGEHEGVHLDAWTLAYDHFDPREERTREALCALGNGCFVTRAAAPESSADDVHYPGTYRAGLYDRLTSVIEGEELTHEDLVNLPNWLPLTFSTDGDAWFELRHVEVLAFRQELDLRRGVLTRALRFRDRRGRHTALTDRRLVHLGAPHLAALHLTLAPEDWSGCVRGRSWLDGGIVNDNAGWCAMQGVEGSSGGAGPRERAPGGHATWAPSPGAARASNSSQRTA